MVFDTRRALHQLVRLQYRMLGAFPHRELSELRTARGVSQAIGPHAAAGTIQSLRRGNSYACSAVGILLSTPLAPPQRGDRIQAVRWEP